MKLSLLLIACGILGVNAVCPNGCSGHGNCDSNDTCTCYDDGKSLYFGYLMDVTKGYNRVDSAQNVGEQAALQTGEKTRFFDKRAFVQKAYTGADCSQRTCPRGVSWTSPHPTNQCLHQDFAECSDQGICDRSTGICACFPGYTGSACGRTSCPNQCNGHGTCQSNIAFSVEASVIDVGSNYGKDVRYFGAWDSGIHYGCKCNSGYRGADCSLKECPSSVDPLSSSHGNSTGDDCSGRGICDYGTGVCQCFSGYTSNDCSDIEALA